MNISKSFMVIGALYLVVGMGFGIYMGGAQEFELAPLHAHINLVGFVLMTLFGMAYRLIPALADGALAKVHFWLYQLCALVMLVLLFLLLSHSAPEATVGPIMGIFEIGLLLAVIAFLANLWKSA